MGSGFADESELVSRIGNCQDTCVGVLPGDPKSEGSPAAAQIHDFHAVINAGPLAVKGKHGVLRAVLDARDDGGVPHIVVPVLLAAGPSGRVGRDGPRAAVPAVYAPVAVHVLVVPRQRAGPGVPEDGVALTDVDAVKDAVPQLLSMLEEEDANIRGAAAGALGEIGGIDSSLVSNAVPKLVTLLEDSDVYVRGAATAALQAIGEA